MAGVLPAAGAVARNDAYWQRGLPKLDGIRFTVISDTQTGLRSVSTGENDFIYALTPQQLAVARRSRGLLAGSSPTLYCQQLYFNRKQGPLQDLRVRQAVNHAIDRDAYNKGSALGVFEVADTLLPRERWAYGPVPPGGRYPHDPARARALLAEAGFAEGVDLNLILYSDQSSQQRAELLIEQFRPAGIRLRLSSAALPEATAQFFQAGQGHAVQGDLSRSLLTGVPVRRAILEKLPNTVEIVVGALLVSMVLGIPLGVAAATRAGS